MHTSMRFWPRRISRTGNPSVYIGMQDPVKWIAFGIAADKVGFVSGANTFLASSIPSAFDYSVRRSFASTKFGTDSVVGYVNGTKKAKVLYSALPNVIATTPPKYFWFGNRVTFNSTNNPTAVSRTGRAVVLRNWSTLAMSERIPMPESSRTSGARPMESERNEEPRRPWIRPELQGQSTLTTVTKVGSPVPMSLLFFQASQQCFDSDGNPAQCPQ